MRPVGAELRFASRAFASNVSSPTINFKCM